MVEVSLRPVPPAAAIAYFRRKALLPSFGWQDVRQEEHGRNFTVAKAMQLDVLEAIRKSLDKALADGTTREKFRAGLEPELRRLGWWGRKKMRDEKFGVERTVQLGSPRRLKIIFDTNLRTAYAAQKWERIQRLSARLPYLVYTGIDDERTRPLHAYWQRVPIVLPVAHEWWNFYYPPNGWNCRCDVLQMSAADLARRGWKVAEPPPKVEFVNWVNRREGRLERVPRGIDPGFGYNVGKAALALKAPAAEGVPAERKSDLARALPPVAPLADRLGTADRAIADAALREIVRSKAFARFVEKPAADAAFPVLRLAAEIAAAVGAKDPIAILSGETMLKQRREHPDLSPADYRMLPELGASPTLVVRDGPSTVVIVRRGEHIYRAAVKRTGTGKATFVTSFRRTHPADVRALLRRGRPIFGEWSE